MCVCVCVCVCVSCVLYGALYVPIPQHWLLAILISTASDKHWGEKAWVREANPLVLIPPTHEPLYPCFPAPATPHIPPTLCTCTLQEAVALTELEDRMKSSHQLLALKEQKMKDLQASLRSEVRRGEEEEGRARRGKR